MNRIQLLSAACLLLLGHLSLAQPTEYGNRRHDDDDNRYSQPSGPGYTSQYPTNGQSGYGNQYPNSQGGYNQPGYPRSYGPNGGYDRRSDIFRIERLDRMVDLNGYQKRELFGLEQYYDRQFSTTPPAPGVYKRLMWQKSQDVLAILTPIQRDRLFAFEQYRAYGGTGYSNNGYGNSYGRGNGNAWGRRW